MKYTQSIVFHYFNIKSSSILDITLLELNFLFTHPNIELFGK